MSHEREDPLSLPCNYAAYRFWNVKLYAKLNWWLDVITIAGLALYPTWNRNLTTTAKIHGNNGFYLASIFLYISWIRAVTCIFANINLFKVKNRNARKRHQICPRLAIKTPEWRQCHHFGAFIVNFEQNLHLFPLFLLLNLSIYLSLL